MSSGADLDSLTIKDKNGLPFVPGRTIKGLVRDAMYEIGTDENDISCLFGEEECWKSEIKDEDYVNESNRGKLFFSNAELPANERELIVREKLVPFITTSISSTAIEDKDDPKHGKFVGIAKNHSLRKIEATVPCTLEGCIRDIPLEADADMLIKALSYIKRLGQGRNRGLGRCTFSATKA